MARPTARRRIPRIISSLSSLISPHGPQWMGRGTIGTGLHLADVRHAANGDLYPGDQLCVQGGGLGGDSGPAELGDGPLAAGLAHLWQIGITVLAAGWLLGLRRGVVSALLGCGALGAIAAFAHAPLS